MEDNRKLRIHKIYGNYTILHVTISVILINTKECTYWMVHGGISSLNNYFLASKCNW